MNSCAWIMPNDEPCGNICEGRTNFCSSHNRQLRRESENERKQSEKRALQIQKAIDKSKEPRKKIKPMSDKRKAENEDYVILRLKFLDDHMECEIKANEYCTKEATTIHHQAGRIGELFLDVTKWKGACMSCHKYVEAHPFEAKEKGWSLSRLAKEKPVI